MIVAICACVLCGVGGFVLGTVMGFSAAVVATQERKEDEDGEPSKDKSSAARKADR